MQFTPIKSSSRDLKAWFATRPDLFTKERSPQKTITWVVIAGIMAIVTILVYVDSSAVQTWIGENLTSSRRRRNGAGWAAILVFVGPPVILLASLGMAFLGSARWRLKGGGVLKNPYIDSFGPGAPIDNLMTAISQGGTNNPAILQGMAAISKDPGKQYLLTIWSSPQDRVLHAGVLRTEGESHTWLDHEPITVSGERWFDADKHKLAADLGKDSIDGL